MQFLKGIAVILLCMVAPSLLADDCPVSTSPRALFSGVDRLTTERFEPENGKYSASFSNGDSVTARFSLCGLGVHASYLVEQESEDLTEQIRFFLMHVSPSENSVTALTSQVAMYSAEDFRSGITLQSANGKHRVQVKKSPSPLYSQVIHYRWIPPEH
ncbi:hypothetical protein HXX02_11605 [Microbulbifer elongatus]|uniref:Reelin domain-containing protein n=1 Tax=Microbulbifer elongatus TaxID=86173 RepID=A0ABT1P1V6_9GAMM|nr:hypothetical protein [Microbulbifer elongatus]MCQ3830095.1 hypothetical protein [Microbulbifer elongatus]